MMDGVGSVECPEKTTRREDGQVRLKQDNQPMQVHKIDVQSGFNPGSISFTKEAVVVQQQKRKRQKSL
jgi:hypothetical protein